MDPAQAKYDITERLEDLVRQADSISDRQARELTIELVRAVMNLHGVVLGRIVEIAGSSQASSNLLDAIAGDEFVSAVLAMHDVHPHRFETRLAHAVEKLRGELKRGEMDIEVKEATPRFVRVRLSGGSPARRAAARHWIQSTVYEAAPEVGDVQIEGSEESPGFVPLESLLATRGAA